LELGIRIRNWNYELESGIGIGIRNWNWELELGIGIWLIDKKTTFNE
jgi:hypothetical protein